MHFIMQYKVPNLEGRARRVGLYIILNALAYHVTYDIYPTHNWIIDPYVATPSRNKIILKW